MNKFLIRFFLSLYIFLLGGYSLLNAHAYEGYVHHSTINLSKKSDVASFVKERSNLVLIEKPTSSVPKKERFRIEITEKEMEEDELVTHKKNLVVSNCFTAFFDTDAHGSFIRRYLKTRLPFGKHFSYLFSYKSLHLIFQVFRI
jgi:hypothetical protein